MDDQELRDAVVLLLDDANRSGMDLRHELESRGLPVMSLANFYHHMAALVSDGVIERYEVPRWLNGVNGQQIRESWFRLPTCSAKRKGETT